MFLGILFLKKLTTFPETVDSFPKNVDFERILLTFHLILLTIAFPACSDEPTVAGRRVKQFGNSTEQRGRMRDARSPTLREGLGGRLSIH